MQDRHSPSPWGPKQVRHGGSHVMHLFASNQGLNPYVQRHVGGPIWFDGSNPHSMQLSPVL